MFRSVGVRNAVVELQGRFVLGDEVANEALVVSAGLKKQSLPPDFCVGLSRVNFGAVHFCQHAGH